MLARRILFVLSLAIAGALAGCTATEEAQEPTIKIGSIWSLTGAGSALDNPGKLGADLVAQKLNESGVLGRKIELVTIDAKSDSASTSAAVREALAEHPEIVGFIGLNDTDPATGAGKVIEPTGLTFVTAGATYPKLPETIGESIFLACFGDNTQAAAAAEFIYDSLHKRKGFILYNEGTTYTKALLRYFEARWQEFGLSISDKLSYSDGALSLTQQIAAIKAASPDFIYVAAVPEDILNVVRQLRAENIMIPIVGGDGWDSHVLEDSLTTTQSDSIYFTTHDFVDASASPAMASFIADYKAENGVEPPSAFAPLGYDAVMLMAKAIEDAGSTEPAAIRTALEHLNGYQMLTGTITYSATQHLPHKSVTILHIVNGHYARAAELLPRSVPAP